MSPGRAKRPAQPAADSLFFKLVRVVNLTARPFVETLARSHRLSLNEWRAMIVVAGRPGVAAHEIAEATGLDKMSVSRAIAALLRMGRIVRRPDPADARRQLIELSADGQRLFATISPTAQQRAVQLLGGLGRAEHRMLERLVDRMIEALQTD